MADSHPSPAPFKLPEDVHLLARLRDQLSDYLSTLERNTDSINEWLTSNQDRIIVGHHQLVRAITHGKDEQKALETFKGLGDLAGFVLNLQDFESLAKTQFGDQSTLAQTLGKAARGFPAKILEELPEIKMPKDGETVEAVGIVPVSATGTSSMPAPSVPELDLPEKKKGFWSSVGGIFKGTDPEEEARQKEDAVRRQWRSVRSELVSLQSDRHYYIDSFMDWIGENLAPEEPQAVADPLMLQYQNPQYVIDLAQHDYAEVNEGKTKRLSTQALAYSRIARTFDEQKIDDFIAFLPSLFPKTETVESRNLKELLLTDYGVASFAELALTQVKDRKAQLALLSTALTLEAKFEIAGLKSDAQIFEKVLGETLAPTPLDPQALQITLDKLKKRDKSRTPQDLIGLGTGPQSTPFYRIAQRFGKDLPMAEKATGYMLSSLSGEQFRAHKAVFAFAQAKENKDISQMAKTMGSLQTGKSGHQFMALWHLAFPGKSILQSLTATASDNKELSWLAENALKAGILDELKPNANAATAKADTLLSFIADHVIASLATEDHFSLSVSRQLIAQGFMHGGLNELRKSLTGANGWISAVVTSPVLDEKQKLEWTAALLEPFGSDVIKANILDQAAKTISNTQARKTLADMEKTFAGNNVRLGADKILTNLDKIANVWYNPEPETLRFTVNGTGHTLMEGVSPHMARETLDLLSRKGTFETEYDGLINPQNIDRIVSGPQGPKISWYRHTGDLNVTERQLKDLHQRADFLHEDDPKTGSTFSINQKSVTLLQPLEDGTHLLVDKFGAVHVLEGTIRLDAKEPLLDLGGVWLNPKNASILSLNTDKDSFDFRVESKEFDDFMDRAAPGEFFYTVPVADAAALKKIEKAIKADDAISLPGSGALGPVHFNMKALGFLMYEDEGDVGFHCRKYGPVRKPGFINAEPDVAQAIFEDMRKNDSLISVMNVVTHKDMVDDAYYDANKELFYLVIGQDILHVPCDQDTAYDVLKKLSKDPDFSVVGANYIENPKKPGVGIVEMPADVISLKRATLLAFSAAQEKTFVTSDSDKFHISLDRAQSVALFDSLEKAGLEKAEKETSATPWVQKLKETLAALPEVTITVKPSITDLSTVYLLEQTLGAGKETKSMPKLDQDFAIATAPVKANDNLRYPAQRTQAPAVRTKPQNRRTP